LRIKKRVKVFNIQDEKGLNICQTEDARTPSEEAHFPDIDISQTLWTLECRRRTNPSETCDTVKQISFIYLIFTLYFLMSS